MGYQLSKTKADGIFRQWAKKYDIFAPVVMEGEGCFSDTDIIRYVKVNSLDEIEWNKKSDYSFKEVLLSKLFAILSIACLARFAISVRVSSAC